MSEATENVKVFIRVRPLSTSDNHKIVQIASDNQEITLLSTSTTDIKYKFNGIFAEHIHQDDAFNTVLVPIVRDIIQGYNSTLFLYGSARDTPTTVTSSNASLGCSTISPSLDDAMISLVSSAIYSLFGDLQQHELSSSIRISYLEIFDEELFDLLKPNGAGTQLKIFENDKSHVYVNGLSETTVHSAPEAMMLLRMAQKNLHSSKSHLICTVSVQSKEMAKFQVQENEELFKFRKMCLVQLGCQESQKKLARAKTVQSLTSLSRVVQALITKQQYIPYRDSKLTRIMQGSLGGNAKTAIIASIGGGNTSIDETTQALELLNRMKGIVNHPKINERLDDARTLSDMTLEIRKLMMDIEANRNKTGQFLTDEMYVKHQEEMHHIKTHSRRYKQELLGVNKDGTDLEQTFFTVHSNLCAKSSELKELESEVLMNKKQLHVVSNVSQRRNEMIDRHANKERVINEQATEVTAAIVDILKDKSNLDDCVLRYKSIDEHLIGTVQRFYEEMQQKLANLSKYSMDTRTIFDTKMHKIGDLEKSFHRNAGLLVELMKTKSFTLLNELEANLKRETTNWNEAKNDFNEIVQSYLKSSDANTTLYTEFARELEEQSQIIESSYKELRELYISHFKAMERHIDDIIQRMKSHKDNTSKLVNTMRLSVDKCASIGNVIDDKMQLIYEKMCEIVIQIQRNTCEMKSSVEPALLASQANVRQAKDAIIESLDAQQIAVNEQKALFMQPQFSEYFRIKQIEHRNVVTEKMMLMHNLLGKDATHNTFAMESIQTQIATIKSSMSSKRDLIETNVEISMLRNLLNERQALLSGQCEEKQAAVNAIASNARKMLDHVNDGINACSLQLKHFREMDFCEYVPSGETPARREYSTEVSLAATTPLDKIKQRFRDRYSQINGASPNANYSFLSN